MTEIDFYDDTNDTNCECDKEINYLLDCAILPRDETLFKLLNKVKSNKYNLLHKAIELGEEKNIALLLNLGVRLDIKDVSGRTPLHVISNPGCQDRGMMLRIAKLILDKSSDPKALLNESTNSGETPLHGAVTSNKKNLIKLFLRYGANVNARTRDGKTSLYSAIEANNLKIAALLLKNRAKVNETTLQGWTALHEAVNQKADEGVKLLLMHGAWVNARDNDGRTSLRLAAELNYLDEPTMNKIVKRLLYNGADVNDRVVDTGETAFHCAIVDGNERLARLFLKHGANVNAKDHDGKSSLHLAVKHSNARIVKLLLERDADVVARTNEGQTALHVAVVVENEITVKLLLEHGADVNASDESGRTALSLAYELAHMRSIYNPWNGFYPISSRNGYRVGDDDDDDNVFELLIKRVAMLDGSVCEENLRVMSTNDELGKFYERCIVEMNKLRAARLCDNITMLNILTRDINTVIVGYARNEKLLKLFVTGVCAREFPIYSRMMSERFTKADNRRKLLAPSAASLARLVVPYSIPELVVGKILAHLRIDDLVNLALARGLHDDDDDDDVFCQS